MEPLKRSRGAHDEIAHRSRHEGSPDDPVPLVVRYSKNACCRRILRVAGRSGEGPETGEQSGTIEDAGSPLNLAEGAGAEIVPEKK